MPPQWWLEAESRELAEVFRDEWLGTRVGMPIRRSTFCGLHGGCGSLWKEVAGTQGFEPRYADPESAVLPLDDVPTLKLILPNCGKLVPAVGDFPKNPKVCRGLGTTVYAEEVSVASQPKTVGFLVKKLLPLTIHSG